MWQSRHLPVNTGLFTWNYAATEARQQAHTLHFLRVSTSVCSRNKAPVLTFNRCVSTEPLPIVWVPHAVNPSTWEPVQGRPRWTFNWVFWVIIKTGVAEKDNQDNLSSFSPHFVICSLIFDRIQDGQSTARPWCVRGLKMMLCYEFMASFKTGGGLVLFTDILINHR